MMRPNEHPGLEDRLRDNGLRRLPPTDPAATAVRIRSERARWNEIG
jgi:hypothetical protein